MSYRYSTSVPGQLPSRGVISTGLGFTQHTLSVAQTTAQLPYRYSHAAGTVQRTQHLQPPTQQPTIQPTQTQPTTATNVVHTNSTTNNTTNTNSTATNVVHTNSTTNNTTSTNSTATNTTTTNPNNNAVRCVQAS